MNDIRVDEFGRVLATCPKCRAKHTLDQEPGQGAVGGLDLPADKEIPRMGRDQLIRVIQNARKALHGV